MPRIRCPQHSCVFWEEGYCGADEIELSIEQLSCLTMEELEDQLIADDAMEWREEFFGDDEEEDDDEGDEEGWDENGAASWAPY